MSRAYMGLVIQQKANDKWRFGAVKCHELAACACVCMHVCAVRTYECVHVCMHLCVCVCVCVRMCVRAYVCGRVRPCVTTRHAKTKRHTHIKRSRGGQRRCRRGSDVREDVGHCFVPRPTTQGPPLLSKKHANRVTGKFSWTRRRRVPHGQNRADVVGSRRVSPLLQRGCRPRGLSRQMHNLHARHPKGTRTPTYP